MSALRSTPDALPGVRQVLRLRVDSGAQPVPRWVRAVTRRTAIDLAVMGIGWPLGAWLAWRGIRWACGTQAEWRGAVAR